MYQVWVTSLYRGQIHHALKAEQQFHSLDEARKCAMEERGGVRVLLVEVVESDSDEMVWVVASSGLSKRLICRYDSNQRRIIEETYYDD